VKDFADVRFIHLTMVDNAGIVRLKMIPIDRLEHVAEFGVGISTVLGVFTVDDHVAYLPGRPGLEGPAGDMRMVPDLDAAIS
jgi:glutamine synthetase